MTPQRQIEALAKWDGWRLGPTKGISAYDAACYGGVPDCWYDPKGKEHDELPDWLHDLNAVARLEDIIRVKGLWGTYGDWLLRARKHTEPSMCRGYDVWLGATANAGQRVESILRMERLWEDDPATKGEV